MLVEQQSGWPGPTRSDQDRDPEPARSDASSITLGASLDEARVARSQSSSRVPAPILRKKAPAPPSTPPQGSTSRLLPSPGSPSPTPRLAIRFGGKVFRTLDTSSGASYSPHADFLGEPDEEVGDLEREQGEKRRRELELKMMSSPAKRPHAVPSQSDAVAHVRKKKKTPETPTKPASTRMVPPLPPLKARISPVGDLGLPFSPFGGAGFANSTVVPVVPPLPPVLASLLLLHCTLESALVMHLASDGSAVASTTSELNAAGEAVLRIPNLINLVELRRKIESGGRTFGERELAMLVWVWEGCRRVEDNDDHELRLETGEAGGMGFVVTRTRANTPAGIVSTFGIGIAVALRANPQRPQIELLPVPSSPSRSPASPSRRTMTTPTPASPGSVGRGREGMSVVALWSQGQEARREEFSARLRSWGKQCAEREKSFLGVRPDAPFPVEVPEIPRAQLPSLHPVVVCAPGTTSPSPTKKRPTDVFGTVTAAPTRASQAAQLLIGRPVLKPEGTVEQRRQGLAERIKAKARGGAAYLESISVLSEGTVPSKKSLKPDKGSAVLWRAEEAARLKRNSMLSRLGTVADGVWMLFDVGRKRALALCDVAASMAKSSKSNLSLDEANESILMLCTISPDFCYTKLVDREPWLYMKGVTGLKEAKELVRQELARSTGAATYPNFGDS